MNEHTDIFLGFDPGGIENFGWSICQGDENQFRQVCSGVGCIAIDVINAVTGALDRRGLLRANVRAAGIDAPLLWDNRGENWREADRIINGAGIPPRTFGMLLGVVLYQGPVIASGLMEQFGALEITEAFPRALRELLVPLPPELGQIGQETTHEQDARAAAYTAWRMCNRAGDAQEWWDLFEGAHHPLPILNFPVHYWMPIPENNPQ